MKNSLLYGIHTLIYHSIYCVDPTSKEKVRDAENAYERRIIGFRGESEFVRKIRNLGRTVLSGGWLLSQKSGNRCLEDAVYFTVCSLHPNEYLTLYKQFIQIGFNKMFFVKYDFDEEVGLKKKDIFNIGEQLICPRFTCFEFVNGIFVDVSEGEFGVDRLLGLFTKKNSNIYKAAYQLSHHDLKFAGRFLGDMSIPELQHIFANRFLFDGLIGYGYLKGVPNDIDIISIKHGVASLLEIKEKDLSKSNPGFGMDVSRLSDILSIRQKTGLNYYYIVREVDNQKDRNFLSWWYIEIGEFNEAVKDKGTIEGGMGMATLKKGNHPTLVAELKNFTEF